MENENYVIGLDYGSDSVRALIVNATNGKEIATHVHHYSRWSEGKFCDPSKNQFRQHPLDYIEGLEIVIKEALKLAPKEVAEQIKAISIDTTGSTPVAVDKNGSPLALKNEFTNNPNAMFILWKDHTAIEEADEINKLSKNWGGVDYTKYSGGIYSSEWFWAKILHTLREDESVRKAAFSWVEHCDWIPALLTGNTNPITMKRGRCSAGHKAMWHKEFGSLPSEDFLVQLDPLLKGLRKQLYTNTYTAEIPVGNLTKEWASKLGLKDNVIIGGGAFDAHMGAVGGQIKPYSLIKVMGTSTCDMLIAPMEKLEKKLIKGICGQVNGSIVPGMLGMEAGQSAFGDLYAWYQKLLMYPFETILKESEIIDIHTQKKLYDETSTKLLKHLGNEAIKRPINETGIIALDWINGRRTPDANDFLKGAISGMTMGTDAVSIYKALVEATAFGSRKIMECFIEEGIEIKEVIALGGVAKKSKFVMQTVSDVMGLKIKVVKSEQACALGAAMFATLASGIYSNISEAQDAMGSGFSKEYIPNMINHAKYAKLYEKYKELGNYMEKRTENEA